MDEAAEKVDDDDQQWPVVDDEVDADEDKEEDPDDGEDHDDEEGDSPHGVLLSNGQGRPTNFSSMKRGASCFLPDTSQ